MYATGGSSGHSPANHCGATPITVYVSTDLDLCAERVVATAVFRLPHRVAQHDDRIAGGRHVLALIEVATESRVARRRSRRTLPYAGDLHVASFSRRTDD